MEVLGLKPQLLEYTCSRLHLCIGYQLSLLVDWPATSEHV